MHNKPTFILALALAAALPAAGGPQPAQYRRSLTDITANRRTESLTLTGREITPRCRTPWSIRKTTLHGGKQEGVEVVLVDNGAIRFAVCPTRGMGILWVEGQGRRFGWESPVKDVVHPAHVNLQARGGLGWLDGFNEWMCRCGLENNGGPGADRFTTNTGEQATMELTLHGKIANLPAQGVEIVVDRAPPYRIHIRGRVDERMFHGPKLTLRTDISTVPGEGSLRIDDVVTNEGGQPQEFQLLYHTNYGRPLLGEGARVMAPAARVVPMNDHAAKGVRQWFAYTGPTPGFVEEVYCLYPLAGANGRTEVLLMSKNWDLGATIAFSTRELPYLTIWKNTAATADGYVTGIEPGTNFPNNRRIERALGRVPVLQPGGRYRATLDFGFHFNSKAVKDGIRRIATLQGDFRTVLEDQPEKKP